jgi:hypothetical protein
MVWVVMILEPEALALVHLLALVLTWLPTLDLFFPFPAEYSYVQFVSTPE